MKTNQNLKRARLNQGVSFIRPSKVQLSKRGEEVLIYIGPNIVSLHRNFLAAIFDSAVATKRGGRK